MNFNWCVERTCFAYVLIPAFVPTIFSLRMDGRHDDLTMGDLKEKQRAIDGMISNLLNFNPVPLMNSELQKRKSVGNISADATSSTSSSPSSQAKKPRGPGRPPKVNVPPASPVVPRPTQGIPLDSIIECLKEINDQKKKFGISWKCLQIR